MLPPESPPNRATWELTGQSRFELRRQLGGGSFGAVYEVLDRERGAKVALKALRRVEPEEIYRFKQEFRALADIAHPNLAELYELAGEGDRWFFTMELVDGVDALDFVRTEPEGFDEARLRAVLVQLVEGLAALHTARQLHRDVKPSNVLVARDGRVVILDFGLAVRLTPSAEISRSTLVGTPVYLAPEVIAGKPATAASDWYAVGVLLYEALTGRPPFEGQLDSILEEKLSREPPAPSTLAPGVPADLDRLCVELLSRSPEARPRGAELLERVGGSPVAPLDRRDGPFVGRVAERTRLAELFESVRHDRVTTAALVGGPSGIGKSALLRRVAGDLKRLAPGAVLLAGRCYEQESVPFKAIDCLVDPLSRYLKQLPRSLAESMIPRDIRALARVFPVLEQVEAIALAPSAPVILRDAQELRRRAFGALRALLSALAGHRPLVLFIDDLQWGDRDSGAWLVELLTPPSPPRLLLLVAYRSEEVARSPCLATTLPALDAMRGPALRVERLDLEALADADARALALALLSREEPASEATVNAVAREAAGWPLLIRELAAMVDGAGTREAPVAAITVDALLRARIAALPDGARRLLEIVAVAGRPVDRAAAERAAEVGDDALATYKLLRRARVLRRVESEGGDVLEAYHDRVREVVQAGLSAEQRKDRFLRLAKALEGAERADAETLAVYFREGGDPARAADFASRAAEEASGTLAFDRAARLYQLTLELRGPDHPAAGALYEALGEASVNAGRGVEAAEALGAAARYADPDRAFELRRRAAEQLLLAGQVAPGQAALEHVLAEVGVAFPTSGSRMLLSIALHLIWLGLRGLGFREREPRDIPRADLRRVDALGTAAKALATSDSLVAANFGLRALLLALAAGDALRVFDALTVALVFAAAGRSSRARSVRRGFAVAEEMAARLRDPLSTARIRLLAGVRGVTDGSPEAAADLEAAASVFRERTTVASWEMNIVQEFGFQHLLWTGAWKEIAERLPGVLAEARDRGNDHLVRGLLLRFGHVPSLLDDDPEGARRIHRGARTTSRAERFSTLDCFSFWTRADIHLYAERGAGRRAHQHIEERWSELQRSRLLSLDSVAFAALNARGRAALAMAASEASPVAQARALKVAVAAAAGLRRPWRPTAVALAELLAAGVAAGRRAPLGEVAARLARAEELLSACGVAHYAAAAKRRRGQILGGDEGAALVAEADAFLTGQGARAPERLVAMLVPGGTAYTRSR